MAIYRQFDGLVALPCVGWTAPFSTRRVDFLSIKLGIRVCRDICGLSNRSSSPHDSLLASLPSGLIITGAWLWSSFRHYAYGEPGQFSSMRPEKQSFTSAKSHEPIGIASHP